MLTIYQTRDITMNDLVAFRQGCQEIIWALIDKKETISGIKISDYIKNLEVKTGIIFKSAKVYYPRQQNKTPKELICLEEEKIKERDKMKLNYDEIIEEVQDQRPVNSHTIGLCHPDTFKSLFEENEKSPLVSDDLYFTESDSVLENHIILTSVIETEDGYNYEYCDLPLD